MYIAIVGRQPELSQAELHQLVGQTTPVSAQTLRIPSAPSIDRLGGTQKIVRIIDELPDTAWKSVSRAVHNRYVSAYTDVEHKITLGISVYDWPGVSARDIQALGLSIKRSLKSRPASLRLLPSTTPELSTASVLHNKLGRADNRHEIVIIRGDNKRAIIAETTQVQNIDAYSARDQARPKRDAFVGMLPPKLAQIMINLAVGSEHLTSPSADGSGDGGPAKHSPYMILDPFCGTGVVLQEALLMGLSAVGSDLSDKMVDYSRQNLQWLQATHHTTNTWQVTQGDAMKTTWANSIDAVVCETYLGQPFSAPPSPAKLREVVANCNRIVQQFLVNLQPQLKAGTPLCIAVPAWRGRNGLFTHLPVLAELDKLGYTHRPTGTSKPLLYHRPDQIVARNLILLEVIA